MKIVSMFTPEQLATAAMVVIKTRSQVVDGESFAELMNILPASCVVVFLNYGDDLVALDEVEMGRLGWVKGQTTTRADWRTKKALCGATALIARRFWRGAHDDDGARCGAHGRACSQTKVPPVPAQGAGDGAGQPRSAETE